MFRTGARLLAVQILRLELGLVALSAGLLVGLVMSLVLGAGVLAVLAGLVLALSQSLGMTSSLMVVGGCVVGVMAISGAVLFSVLRSKVMEKARVARQRAPTAAVSAVAQKISSSMSGAAQEERTGASDAFARFGGVAGLGAAAFSLISVLGLRRTVGLTRLAATAVGLAASVPEVKSALDAMRASIKSAPEPRAEGSQRGAAPQPAPRPGAPRAPAPSAPVRPAPAPNGATPPINQRVSPPSAMSDRFRST